MNELSLKRILLREEQEREDSYIWSLPVVRHLREIVLQSPATFFCGENGMGNPRFWRCSPCTAASTQRAERKFWPYYEHERLFL